MGFIFLDEIYLHANRIAPDAHRTYGSSNSNWYVKFQMFMSARAFWRVSYFAVFYTEYLNFSWYNLIEAYIFFNLHLKDHL